MATTGSVDDVLDRRDADALTRKMTVLEDIGDARGAPGLYVVVSDSGRSYLVDVDDRVCGCDDSLYRNPDGGCIHVRRVQFATSRRGVPEWVNDERVDDQLGVHVQEDHG